MTISTLKKINTASTYFDPEFEPLTKESADRLFELHSIIHNKITALNEQGEDTYGLTLLLCAVGDGARAILTMRDIAKVAMREETERNAEVREIS